MNKEMYLNNLEIELRKNKVSDIDDVISEYEEHFKHKLEDGYSEEEIAARLGEPKELARQYGEASEQDDGRSMLTKIAMFSGLLWLDIFVYMIIFAMFMTVIAIAMTSFACGLGGICMLFGLGRFSMFSVPAMPYLGSFLWGIGFIALGVLAAVGTYYSWRYVVQATKAYNAWNVFVITGKRQHPPTDINPRVEPKTRRRIRAVTLVSLAVAAVTIIAGYIALIIMSGSFEPWHVYGWFV